MMCHLATPLPNVYSCILIHVHVKMYLYIRSIIGSLIVVNTYGIKYSQPYLKVTMNTGTYVVSYPCSNTIHIIDHSLIYISVLVQDKPIVCTVLFFTW